MGEKHIPFFTLRGNKLMSLKIPTYLNFLGYYNHEFVLFWRGSECRFPSQAHCLKQSLCVALSSVTHKNPGVSLSHLIVELLVLFDGLRSLSNTRSPCVSRTGGCGGIFLVKKS